MMVKSIPGTLILLITFGACSGGGGGDNSFEDEADALVQRYSMASAPDPSELVGEATMSGFVGFGIDGPTDLDGMIGIMDMVANFDTIMINGTASEMRNAMDMDNQYEGELVLSGTITDDLFNGSLIGGVTGTIDDGGVGSTFDANIVLGVDGQFRTDSNGFLAYGELFGETDLEVMTGGVPSIYNDQITDGLFLVGE